jgi:hypothetical protein
MIRRKLLLRIVSPEGELKDDELKDDDSLVRCMDGDLIEIVI